MPAAPRGNIQYKGYKIDCFKVNCFDVYAIYIGKDKVRCKNQSDLNVD